MKKIIIPFITLCLLFSLAISAFAAEDDFIEENTEVIDDVVSSTLMDNQNDITYGINVLSGTSYYTPRTVTAQETSGLKAALLSVLGDYSPVIVEYQYTNSFDGSITIERTSQPDYAWIAAAVLVIVFIFCLFKLGVAICKR